VGQYDPIERLASLESRHSLSAQEQFDIISNAVDFAKNSPLAFVQFIDIMDEELQSPQMAVAEVKDMLQNPVADLEAFFDRDLSLASLNNLTELESSGDVPEMPSTDLIKSAVLAMTPFDYEQMRSHLTMTDFDSAYHEGAIVTGCYTRFDDGSIAAVALVHATPANGGPYLDAWLCLPPDKFPDTLNPSLPATRDMDQIFEFQYPDGTYRVIKLVSAAGQQECPGTTTTDTVRSHEGASGA